MADFKGNEETKLRLLAALKDANKFLTTAEWAGKTGVDKATVYRYLPMLMSEKWLNSKPGPGRTVLYSVKSTKYVPPVGAIEEAYVKPDTLIMNKHEAAETLFKLMMSFTNKPGISGSMLMYPNLIKASVLLHLEVARALSGEMVHEANLKKARQLITERRDAVEKLLTVTNTLLATPELWDVRSVHKFLAGDKPYDQIQLAMWTRDADDNADALLDVLQGVMDGSLFELLANQTEA